MICYVDRLKVAGMLLVLLACLLVVGGMAVVFIFHLGNLDPRSWSGTLFYCGLTVAGLLFEAKMLLLLLRVGPEISMDEIGLTDHGSGLVILWTDVRVIQLIPGGIRFDGPSFAEYPPRFFRGSWTVRTADGGLTLDFSWLTPPLEEVNRFLWALSKSGALAGTYDGLSAAVGQKASGKLAVFERFTASARRVMQQAFHEAQRRNDEFVGTDHLLLGLLRDQDGPVKEALHLLDVPVASIAGSVEQSLRNPWSNKPVSHLPLTPSCRRVFRFGAEEAQKLHHQLIGPEHLLLGLLREKECDAAQILTTHGLTFTALEEVVARVVATSQREAGIQTSISAANTISADELQEILVEVIPSEPVPGALEEFSSKAPVSASASQAIQPAESPESSGQAAKREQRSAALTWEEFRASSPAVQRALLKLVQLPVPHLEPVPQQALPANADFEQLGKPLGGFSIPENTARIWLMNMFFFGCIVLGLPAATISALILSVLVAGPPLGQIFEKLFAASVAVVLGFVSLLCIFGCVYCRRFSRRWWPITLWVFENGLQHQQGHESISCRWEDIEDFRWLNEIWVSQVSDRPLIQLRLPGKSSVFIPANNSANAFPLAEYIESKITAVQFLPTMRRLFEGEVIDFGAIALDWSKLTNLPNRISWTQIVRVGREDAMIQVDGPKGERKLQVAHCDVSFSLLLMILAQVIIEEQQGSVYL